MSELRLDPTLSVGSGRDCRPYHVQLRFPKVWVCNDSVGNSNLIRVGCEDLDFRGLDLRSVVEIGLA